MSTEELTDMKGSPLKAKVKGGLGLCQWSVLIFVLIRGKQFVSLNKCPPYGVSVVFIKVKRYKYFSHTQAHISI